MKKIGAKRIVALALIAALCMSLMPSSALKASAAGDVYGATVTVTYYQTEARSMLEYINEFRTGDNAWCYDEDGSVYWVTGLSELEYDYGLEEAAMQRAAEVALSFSHTRTNGSYCTTVYSELGYTCYVLIGENCAAGYSSAEKTFNQLAEENADYSGQGHRRNMLGVTDNRVGIACVYCNGIYFWVQEFAYSDKETEVTEAYDGEAEVSVNILASDITSQTAAFSTDSYTLVEGDEIEMPELTSLKIKLTNTYGAAKPVTPDVIAWSGDDASITVDTDTGTFTTATAGESSVNASIFGTTYSIPVTTYELTFVWDGTDCTAVFTNPDYDSETSTGEETYEVTCAVAYDGTEPDCTTDGIGTYTASCTFGDSGNIYTDTKTVTTPATGHSYDEGAVTAEATCEEDGVKTYTCTACGATYTEAIPATGHDWSEPTWNWSEDETSATATFTCGNDETETETVTAAMTPETLQELDCESNGIVEYTATVAFDGSTYTDTKTVTTPATGHSYDEGVVTTEATCESDGVKTYTCETCGKTYTEAIPATGHDWSLPAWKWSEDGTSATATFTCGNDAAEVETVTAMITSETLQKLGCEADGIVEYTATVTFDGGTYIDTKTVTTPATGHDWTTIPVWSWAEDGTSATASFTCGNDATEIETVTAAVTSETLQELGCESNGIVKYTATVTFDGNTYIDSKTVTTLATGHSYDNGTVTLAATCTEDGIMTYICTVCGNTYTEVIPATGHDWSESVWNWAEDGTAATATFTCGNNEEHVENVAAEITPETLQDLDCEADGIVKYTATVTFEGKIYTDTKTVTTPATGHDWNAPLWSWTEDGTSATATFICGNDEDHVEAVAAEIVSETNQALGCETDGIITYTATVAFGGETYTSEKTVTTPTTGHSYDDGVVTKEATCTEDGVKTYTCASCGSTYTEVIPATGHNWSEPTWSWAEDGSSATAAFTCGNDETEVETVTAEITPETLQELGCETDGIVKYTATVSFNGKIYTDEITVTTPATGHDYDEGWVSMEPTCTEDGKMVYTCITCGEILVEAIPATGHSYTETERIEPTCTEDGWIAYTCGNCGVVYTEALEATGHTADEGAVTKEATCTENGEITYTCTACGETWAEEISATGHTVTHVDAKAATETENGNIEYWHCSACGKYFADEALTVEITEADTVLAATGSTAEGSTTPEATETTEAEETETTEAEESSDAGAEADNGNATASSEAEATATAASETTANAEAENVTTTVSGSDSVASTADSAPVAVWIALLLLAGSGIAALGFGKKKAGDN